MRPNTVLNGGSSNVGNDNHVGLSGKSNDDHVGSPHGNDQHASVVPSPTDDTASHATPESLGVNERNEREDMFDLKGFDECEDKFDFGSSWR